MDDKKISDLRDKIRILERETGGVWDSELSCCGVTNAQCHTVLEVGKKGEISLADLAQDMGVDASTMSRTIQGLVLIGLVDRQASDTDRRRVAIRLTDQGRRVFEDIETRYNAYFGKVVELLPADRRESILDSVGEFADAVRRLNEQTGCCRKGKRP